MDITDLKKGSIIQVNGTPHRVVKYNHSSPARGSAVVRTKLRDMRNGSMLDKTFRKGDKIESADIDPVEAQFLYTDGEQAYFMRLDTYDQMGIARAVLGEQIGFLKEGMEIKVLLHQGKPLNVELPTKIELEVISADPSVKGNSATNVTKQCRVETGMEVSVPMFIESGDRIKVDTRSNEYVERA
jgi:elongation factor P